MIVRCFTGGPFAENAYLVSCVATGEAIVVDPGGAVRELLDTVEDSSLKVTAIVLTHAHVDHVDGVAEAKRRTGAPVYLHPADAQLYQAAPVQAQWFGVRIETPPPVDLPLADAQRITFGHCELEVRNAPGHAPGHVVLVGEGAALVGDCIFAGSIGRTDLPGGDLQTLMSSIRSVILTLPDETVLYPGHGGETTVGHERATNPFLTPNLGGSAFA